MTAPPSAKIFLMEGAAPCMRLSSVILKFSSKGTLKSTRINAFLPEKFKSSIVFIYSFYLCVIVHGSNRGLNIEKSKNTCIYLSDFNSIRNTSLYTRRFQYRTKLLDMLSVFAQLIIQHPHLYPLFGCSK